MASTHAQMTVWAWESRSPVCAEEEKAIRAMQTLMAVDTMPPIWSDV